MGRISKFIECIEIALERGYLQECFTAEDVENAFERLCKNENICCDFSKNTFSTFLSKHCEGNKGNYKVYFERCPDGSYRLR